MDVYLFETKQPDGSITRAPHAGQKPIMEDNTRFKVVVCGRRFGKTLMSIVTLIEKASSGPNKLVWYIAPTYRQAKMIAWRLLMSRIRLFPEKFQLQCKINESALSIMLPNGSFIELKGVDNPDSLRGQGVDYMVLDEYADDNYSRIPVWQEILRPALSDKMGGAIFISTPKGYNHLYDLFEYADSKKDEQWKAWRMPTSSNPYISRKELLDARKELGEDVFIQEYEAQFTKKSGLIYKEFNRDIHVIDPLIPDQISAQWYMEVGVDFGASHPTAGIFVLFSHIDDTAYVVDEYYQGESMIEDNAAAMFAIENKWMKRPNVRWGDSAGKQEILEYGSRKNRYFLSPTVKGAGSVEVGIDKVKSRLRDDVLTRKPKLYICRNCVNLIKEFENYRWRQSEDENKKAADRPVKVYDDAMDALRYVISHHTVKTGVTKLPMSKHKRNPLTGY